MTLTLLAALALLALAAAAGATAWAWQSQRRLQRLAADLQASRAQAQALAGSLDAWVWRTDAQHRLTLLHPPASIDAPGAAPQGQPLLWDHFLSADDSLRARLQSQAPLHALAVSQAATPNDASARSMPLLLRGMPVLDAEGRFAGHVGTARAVRDAAAPPPAQAIAAAPIDTAARDSEAFSYTISHDLRAPIRVVDGFARILKEDYGRLLDRIGNDHLDRVLSAAARMNSMIDALLALSHLSTQPLARQPVNISQLAGYIVDDLRRQSPGRQVDVYIQPGMQVQGDATLLRVALENLIGNAWKYSAKSREARIRCEQVQHEGRPAICVSDNGAGFDMRFADRLFGVFQRLHSASDFQGTGIGLASVRRILRRHGGDIWAEGEVDRGARFVFWLGA